MLRCLIPWFDIMYYEIIKGYDGGENMTHSLLKLCLRTGDIVFLSLVEHKYHFLTSSITCQKSKKKRVDETEVNFPNDAH